MADERSTSQDLRARYEELRAWAIGDGTRKTIPRGLTLLLRQGLPGWVEAWSHLLATPARRAPLLHERSIMPSTHPAVATELTVILAEMVFSAARS